MVYCIIFGDKKRGFLDEVFLFASLCRQLYSANNLLPRGSTGISVCLAALTLVQKLMAQPSVLQACGFILIELKLQPGTLWLCLYKQQVMSHWPGECC